MALNPEVVSVAKWGDYVSLAATEFKDRWLFRGTLDYPLSPSLQRVARGWGIETQEIPRLERHLLREFKRSYPPNGAEPRPEDDDTDEWLALMQHYGAPTRLLDFTYSPFIAAFFALDALLLSPDCDMAVVWAFSVDPASNRAAISSLLPTVGLKDAYKRYLNDRNGKDFRTIFFEADPPIALATPVNPYKLNQRLVLQQGVFLCPGDIERTFEDNLRAVLNTSGPRSLMKILLPRSILRNALTSLHQMGCTHATLFPGIDGYSRNLRQKIGLLLSGQVSENTRL